MIRIIANKKIDLTNDEFAMYQDILNGYDPKTKPELMFRDLFETDDNGLIVFLRTPKNTRFTMEVFLYLSSVMLQQHLRVMHNKVNQAIIDLKKEVRESNKQLSSTPT